MNQTLQSLTSARLSSNEIINSFVESTYFTELKNQYERMRWDLCYESRIHGSAHVEHVIALGAVLAMMQQLSDQETRLLLLCCAYHDIGRLNDDYDTGHGRRAANLIEEHREELGVPSEFLPEIQAAVATHAVEDNYLDNFMDIYGAQDRDLCRLLCQCLKDADGLDRVRFMGLNVNYLRSEESKQLVSVAYDLCFAMIYKNFSDAIYANIKNKFMEKMAAS